MSAALELGKVGIWTSALDYQPAARAQAAARELEDLGFRAIWVPESFRREAIANASLLLGGTERMVIATGIASIYARDAVASANAMRTLAEAYGGRFLLGLGVSHRPGVEEARGHVYGPPVPTMRAYLEAMKGAPFHSPSPHEEPPVVLAALGPLMLKLAAEKTQGAHPYFVPVEHTTRARVSLGAGPLLAPEQAVVFETDPARARAIARKHTTSYLRLENYTANLRRLGFGDADLEDGGSDRLVDAVVAWGDAGQVKERIQAHLAAGADHVCIQVLGDDPTALPVEGWRRLAAIAGK